MCRKLVIDFISVVCIVESVNVMDAAALFCIWSCFYVEVFSSESDFAVAGESLEAVRVERSADVEGIITSTLNFGYHESFGGLG